MDPLAMLSNLKDTFNPACPCCQEEIRGASSASTHRHAESNPKETMRKQLTQCQNCYTSRGPGVTLLRCKRCQIDIYCSKECQRQAWPSHKEKCNLNRRINEISSNETLEKLKALRAYTSKHRPTIADCAVRALDVYNDPTRTEREVLLILLYTRPNATRTETSFYVGDATTASFELFGPEKSEEMHGQLCITAAENLKNGMDGTLFVVLFCVDSGVSNIAPMGFCRAEFRGLKRHDWKDFMTKCMNEGIVH